MSQAIPQMRNLAERLIAYETMENGSVTLEGSGAFPVSEKLRPNLAALVGNGGVGAHLSRALVLAASELLWLQSMRVKSDGSLEWVYELRTPTTPDEFLEGRVVLLAQLLGLLVAFIGEALTLRLLHEVWPKVPLVDSAFTNGVSNEKTN